MAGTSADAAACSFADQWMALCTPAPTLPRSTYTVVGFMGTGRVTFNAALAAVFIEVRRSFRPVCRSACLQWPESLCAVWIRPTLGEGGVRPASCVLPRPHACRRRLTSAF